MDESMWENSEKVQTPRLRPRSRPRYSRRRTPNSFTLHFGGQMRSGAFGTLWQINRRTSVSPPLSVPPARKFSSEMPWGQPLETLRQPNDLIGYATNPQETFDRKLWARVTSVEFYELFFTCSAVPRGTGRRRNRQAQASDYVQPDAATAGKQEEEGSAHFVS